MSDPRERTVRWEDPALALESARGRSGLEVLRAIVAGELPPPPMARLLGFDIVEAKEGRVVFAATPGEHVYNPLGLVHGGFACTLLDSAMGCSIHSMLPAGVGYSTTDLQIRFIRGMSLATGEVRAEGRAVHVGRSTAVAEGRLTDGKGTLFAVATTGCAIFRP